MEFKQYLSAEKDRIKCSFSRCSMLTSEYCILKVFSTYLSFTTTLLSQRIVWEKHNK